MFKTKNTIIALCVLSLFTTASASELEEQISDVNTETTLEETVAEELTTEEATKEVVSEEVSIEETSEEVVSEEATSSEMVSIAGVDYVDEYNLELDFDTDVLLGSDTEMKLYKQTEYSDLFQSPEAANSVVVTFDEDEFNVGDTFSLISLTDLDINSDFTIDSDNYVNENTSEGDWSTIQVLDPKTLVITLKEEAGELPILKFLKEVKIESVDYQEGKTILSLESALTEEKSYIVMLLEAKDEAGIEMDLGTSLYDFTVEEGTFEEYTDVEDNIEELEALNAAEELEEKDITDIALEATTTPDTGTKEVFVLILSLILCGGLFLSFRKNA